jgi:hypothetical protein
MREAMASPLRSSTTPARRVASAEMPKMVADRAVLTPFFVAACSVLCWECPRGSSWLSGASPDSCQGRDVPARLSRSRPTTQRTAMRTEAGASRQTFSELGSWLPATTTPSNATTSTPSSTSTNEAAW